MDQEKKNDENIFKKIHKMKKRTKFTFIAIFNIVWYAIAVLVLSYYDKIVPSELTISWFSAWTIELALLFGIKVKSKNDMGNYNGYQESDIGYFDKGSEQDYESQDENQVQDYDDGLG